MMCQGAVKLPGQLAGSLLSNQAVSHKQKETDSVEAIVAILVFNLQRKSF